MDSDAPNHHLLFELMDDFGGRLSKAANRYHAASRRFYTAAFYSMFFSIGMIGIFLVLQSYQAFTPYISNQTWVGAGVFLVPALALLIWIYERHSSRRRAKEELWSLQPIVSRIIQRGSEVVRHGDIEFDVEFALQIKLEELQSVLVGSIVADSPTMLNVGEYNMHMASGKYRKMNRSKSR